jgi:hypothetical protein
MTGGVTTEFGVESLLQLRIASRKALNKLGSIPIKLGPRPYDLSTVHARNVVCRYYSSHQVTPKKPELHNLIYKHHSAWKFDT